MNKLIVKINAALGYPTFHLKKPFFFNAQNPKQMGWAKAIKTLNRKDLVILETGRIRNPDWHFTDGFSTYFFSKISIVKKLISIDNDSENVSGYSTSQEFCMNFLSQKQLAKMEFMNGDSRIVLTQIPPNVKLDVVLLDSANNPELIFEEFMAVKHFMRKDKSLLIIDDTEFPGKKGDKLIPYLKEKGVHLTKIVAPPGNCEFAILTKKDFDNLL